MADENKILSASGGSSFDDTLESASKSIERVVKAADTAEKKLGELEDRFNSTADRFKEASGSIKSDIAALRSSMSSKNSFEMLNELKDTNSELKEMEERLRKINKFGSGKNKKSSGSVGGGKNKKINLSTAGDIASLAGDMLGVSKTAGKASKGLVALGGKLGMTAGAAGAAGLAAGLLVTALSVLADISLKSQANILKTSTALRQMGLDVGDVGERSIEASKSINDLKNRISNGLNDIGGVFADFINGVAIKVDGLLDALGIGDEGEVSGKIAGVLASISADSKQSGFSQNSAAVLASGTYSVAQILENKGLAGGKQSSEIANDLAEAWLTGSDAAKEYGIVVNDNVLTGYLASQGIDIANVEITDAMKQYYRYQLMMEQATASNSSEMQDLIKDWTQLGFMIDKTKNKLFSFDEVITLSAADPTIPEVFGDIINPSLDGDGDTPDPDKPPVTPPVVPPVNPPAPPFPEFVPDPIYVPVIYYEPEPYAPPVPVPVVVPVMVPGFEVIPQLVAALAYVYELLPMPVEIPVTVPGLEVIPQLVDVLYGIPGLVPVNIPVTVPGYELAPALLTYCMQLASQVFASTVDFTIPSLGLAPVLLGYLEQIAVTWLSKVDISVVGQAALEKAYSLLQQVRSMLASFGQSVMTGANRVRNTVTSGVSTAYGNIKNTALSFNAGFAGKGKTSSLISSWAPTSAAAYGGGLLGSLKADLDLNAVRLGLKSSTKEGYTKQNISSATADYVGYNLNPLNKNGAVNLGIKGAALSALASAGYGAITSAAGSAGAALKSGADLLFPSPAAGLAAAAGFADGGIGTREIHNASLFEGNKKEAVIPLESTEGIRYLSNALHEAGLPDTGNIGGDIIINLTLSGVNMANNEAEWERVGKKIAEVIDIQRQRRGELSYGSSF